MRADDLSRRDFLAAGTGLFVFAQAAALDAQQPAAGARRPSYPTDFNAYLRIGDGRPGDRVSSGKIEMGQGEMTALAQCLAEELDVAYDAVDMVMGDTELCPWDSGTGGSTCIQVFSPVLRRAGGGGEGRFAAKWRPSSSRRRWSASRSPTGWSPTRRRTSGSPTRQMVQGKRIERHLGNVPVKSPAEFRLIGRPQPWKGAVDMVTGKTKYTGDISLPGMLWHGS